MARTRLPQVAVITDARRGTTLDLEARTKRYLITMGIRTACFLGMIVVPGVWKLVLLVGAALLPGIAVLFANAEDRHVAPFAPDDSNDPWTAPALPAGTVIPGEVEED
jgi:hypothetical protein